MEIESNSKVETGQPEPGEKRRLKRDIAREAMTRKEDAAETDEDFEEIVSDWDRLDRNRERRERYHEVRRENVLLDLESPQQMNEDKRARKPMRVNHGHVIIPAPFTHIWWREMLSGKNIDLIYGCPLQCHHMTSNHQAYGLLRFLMIKKPFPKEIFFFLAIIQLSTKMLGKMRNQTDRYMRKIYRGMIDELRYELFFYLYCKYKKRLPLTGAETRFVMAGIEKYNSRKEMDWKLNEEDSDDSNGCIIDPGYNQELNKYYELYCADPDDEDDDTQSDEEKRKNAGIFKNYNEVLDELRREENADDDDSAEEVDEDEDEDEDYDYGNDFYEKHAEEHDEDGNPLDGLDVEV